jgi:hypothetical protein
MDYTKFEIISIKANPGIDEKWVKTRIAEDPSILGLGDVVLKDIERPQPRAGILDLLLQDTESNSRYEVEVQLGQTDESHIIRTIEYWDIERRRFPQYEHTAVIIAEDITSRFLNVISLFNGMIPLIAIQMKALKNGNNIGLIFTTVVNQMPLGLVGEDEEVSEAADRAYWEQRGTKRTVAIADELVELAKKHDKLLELKYNKFYIGLAKEGQPRNFVIFRPQKGSLRLEPRLKKTPEASSFLESAGLDVMDYDNRWGRYRIRLQSGEVEKHRKVLEDVISRAFIENSKE